MDQLIVPINADLELRSLTLEDAPALFALTDTNRAYLRQWLPWLDATKTASDTETFIRDSLQAREENGKVELGIWYQGKLVGTVGLHNVEHRDRKAAIGYWLEQGATGKNIMTESVRCLLDYSFQDLKLNRVEIHAAVENKKSRGVAERLGFKEEGTLRESAYLYDHYIDMVMYAMLASDWGK